MNIWKDKEGKKVGTKEFFSRWKSGIQSVTQIQILKSNIIGFIIILIGIIWGIVFTIISKQYWLLTILSGALLVQSMSFLGILQKYFMAIKMRNLQNGEEVKIL